MNILFWNINKRNLKESICKLSILYNIDIIILAESILSSSEILLAINKEDVEYFPQHPLSQCDKIQIFSPVYTPGCGTDT